MHHPPRFSLNAFHHIPEFDSANKLGEIKKYGTFLPMIYKYPHLQIVDEENISRNYYFSKIDEWDLTMERKPIHFILIERYKKGEWKDKARSKWFTWE